MGGGGYGRRFTRASLEGWGSGLVFGVSRCWVTNESCWVHVFNEETMDEAFRGVILITFSQIYTVLVGDMCKGHFTHKPRAVTVKL